MNVTTEEGLGAELFVNSATIIDQPEELRRRMSRDGYLFFCGLIPAEALHELYDAILAICQQHGWADAQGCMIGRPKVEGDPEYFGVYEQVQRLESFHALAHRPELTGVIKSLVQETVLVHPRNIARISPPNAQKFTTPPHQDFALIQGTTETYTAWIPLRNCPMSLGGLAVLAGSHMSGLLPVHKADGPGGVGVETRQLGLGWHTNDFKLGEVLIFNSMTIHKALPNKTSDQFRISVDYRYQGVSQPIVHDGLDPHYNLAGWSAVYRGWTRTDLQYYWRQYELRLVPRDMSLLDTH